MLGRTLLPSPEELLHGEPDILGNLPQQRGGDVAAGVIGNRRSTPVGVTILPVRAALTDLVETQPLQQRRNLPWLERGQVAHYATLIVWTPINSDSNLGSPSSRDGDNLLEIALKLIEAGSLSVCPRPTWHVADVEARVWITLDHDAEASHWQRGSSPPEQG